MGGSHMSYEVGFIGDSGIAYWEGCNARTLDRAQLEASWRYRSVQFARWWMIAQVDNNGNRRIVASRFAQPELDQWVRL